MSRWGTSISTIKWGKVDLLNFGVVYVSLYFGVFLKTKVTFRLGFGFSSSSYPWKRIPRSVGLHGTELWRFEIYSTVSYRVSCLHIN